MPLAVHCREADTRSRIRSAGTPFIDYHRLRLQPSRGFIGILYENGW
ncbi:hypothetical protein ASZ90_010672 [hydrocarbon metagenome]|uniref:Uncharacterized protein n=1 Tax=hydrocarbon metagenome TaxID=938273 RepID=A0A0W8FFN1_9ZZZZ